MFGASSTPVFGSTSTPAFGSSLFGGSSTPAFGASTTSSLFGSSSSPAFGSSSTPAFGATPAPSIFGAASTPAFGATSTPPFGATSSSAFGVGSTPSIFGSSSPAFGATSPSPFGASSTSAFGSSTPAFVGGSTPSLFGASSSSIFGGSSMPAFGPSPAQSPFGAASSPAFPTTTPFGVSSSATSLFGSASTPPLFTQPTLGFSQTQSPLFGTPSQALVQGSQLTTQMAPVALVSVPLPDRELQAIIDAYKDDLGNPRYAFRHLLLSVTDPAMHIKPVGISDIMWSEAINKLEGMETADRERLWPELVQGFKDLSKRLKLQDEALAADAQRLQTTEANVKLLQRHFEIDTVTWIQRLRQKEQELQRRLLKMMRIVEGLEGKGFRMPLTKGEAQLGIRIRNLAQQLVGPRAEFPRRVDSLLSSSRMQVSTAGFSHAFLPGNNKIDDQSLAEMHKVLLQQTEAIGGLVSVLKRDIRDMEIIWAEGTD